MTRLRRHFRTLLRASDGATALEFALIGPVLFLLVIGTVEVALIYSAQSVMESATYSASRLGKTGTETKTVKREQAIKAELERRAGSLMDPSRVEISSLVYKDFSEIGQPEPFVDANKNGKRDNGENFTDMNKNGTYDLDRGAAGYGATGEVVVYSVRYPWKLFTPVLSNFAGQDGVMLLTSRAVVKNEPF